VTVRLFLRVMATEAKKRLTYRVDFWLQAFVVFGVEALLAWAVWKAVFVESGSGRISGLDFPGAVLYQVTAILSMKVVRGSEFSDQVSDDIYTGGYSRYLLYPLPYFGFKYASQLGSQTPNALQLVVFGTLAPIVLTSAVIGVSPAGVVMAVPSLLVANLLYYVMSLALQGVAFWADNVWSLMVAQRLLSAVLGGALFPLAMLPEGARRVFDLLPFRHLYADPIETILGRRDVVAWATDLGVALAWCGVFALLGRLVFRRGRLSYSGVGI
jgi:ABC-2 type transport system permease protein